MSQISGAIHSFGTTNASTPSGEVAGTFLVMVDWCGNWFFDFYMAEWELKSQQDADSMLKATPLELAQIFATLLSEEDRMALSSDELASWMHDTMHEAYKTGIRGACDDSLAIPKWDFDPVSIRIPVQVWHGEHDKFVPFSHGQWLASRIPRAEAHLEKNEGHLGLFVDRIPDVHAWLAAKF